MNLGSPSSTGRAIEVRNSAWEGAERLGQRSYGAGTERKGHVQPCASDQAGAIVISFFLAVLGSKSVLPAVMLPKRSSGLLSREYI